MKTLQEQWREFRDKVYPDGMTAEQNKQLHRAFFSGALVMFQSIDLATDTKDEELGALEVVKLKNEVYEVLQVQVDVIKGRN